MSLPKHSAEAYHAATSYERNHLTPHSLDWPNQPRLLKGYPSLPRLALDRHADLPEVNFFSLGSQDAGEKDCLPPLTDYHQICALLRLTHDITAVAMHGKTPFYFRSVASAGALYPFELYLAIRRVAGMDPGIYHYDPFQFGLTQLRKGIQSPFPPVDQKIAATFYISGIFFRSAWKYRSRAYRYVLLDGGHLVENLRLALTSLSLPFRIDLDFDDEMAATLLGLEPEKEVCLAAVHLLQNEGAHSGNSHPEPVQAPRTKLLPDSILRASVVSAVEIDYPSILQVHQAGKTICDPTGEGVKTNVAAKDRQPDWRPFSLAGWPAASDYVQVLKDRRSKRNFVTASDAGDSFTSFIGQLFRQMGNRSEMPFSCRTVLTTGFLAGEGLSVDPGFYLMDANTNKLACMQKGSFIEAMAHACLDQLWLKNAALHLLFMTDLAELDKLWGARGYRYAMIEAGRLGQQAYLTATAVGWGACGIGAIYDREAAQLLGLSNSEALLYLVGIGPVRSRKRRQ